MSLRILADGIAFENLYQRGVQRCFRELFNRVAPVAEIDLFLSAIPRAPLPDRCKIIYRKERFPARRRNLPLRLWRRTQQLVSPTRFSGHSIFHSTYFTQSPESNVSEVVTVHDMLAEEFQHLFRHRRDEHIVQTLRCLESAHKIICISHATAAELVQRHPKFKDKVRVVHHGADHFLSNPDDERVVKTAAHDRYLLFVGDREGYKNFNALMHAMTEKAWPTGLKLVAVGGTRTVEEENLLQHLRLNQRVRFTGYVADDQLRSYYLRSTGFIFPSLGEGFGFPLLEAQSLKIPVACSDIPVFHEVGGKWPVFFDPTDPSKIAAAVATLLSEYDADRLEGGCENVRRFRWDDCAAKTVDVYQECAKKA